MESAGFKPSDRAGAWRAFMFTGPRPPAPEAQVVGSVPLLGVSENFQATPQYGRMAAEASVIFAPFGLAAGLLWRRQIAPRQLVPVPPPAGFVE